MKTSTVAIGAAYLVAWTGTFLAGGCLGEGSVIKWQCDDMRAKIRKYEAQVKFADEFARTNTNPQRMATIEMLNFQWKPRKGDIELGYRGDGVVVWRVLPEGESN